MKQVSIIIALILMAGLLLAQTAKADSKDSIHRVRDDSQGSPEVRPPSQPSRWAPFSTFLTKPAKPEERKHWREIYTRPPAVGDTFSASGKVIRLSTRYDNTNRSCMAVIQTVDGKACEATADYPSQLCNDLINAFELQKTVVVSGEIEKLGSANELGNLELESLQEAKAADAQESFAPPSAF